MSKTIQVAAFRRDLSRVLKDVERGVEFDLVSRGRTVARLAPPPRERRLPFGLLKGRIWMAPDWDEPDEALIDIMENGPIFPE